MSTRIIEAAIEEFLSKSGVTEAAMFGSRGLKVKNKYFALLVKGKLVVKLSKSEVDNLVESKQGDYFDPGHGRKMKEWVVLDPKSRKKCLSYMDAAYDAAISLAAKIKSKSKKAAVA